MWSRLAAGTAGKFLRTGGTGADPTWSYPEIIIKTTGETINNSTTLQDDDELKFAVAAGEICHFMVILKYVEDVNTAADIKVAVDAPAAITDGQIVPINGIKVNESDVIALQGAHNINGGGAAIPFGTALASRYAHLMGYISNGANAGNVVVRWAQNTAQTHIIVVQAGSAIIVWRAN